MLLGLGALLAPRLARAQAPAFATARSTGTAYATIGATGTSFTFPSTNADDNTSTAVALPTGFAFSYLGTAVTSFKASTNGWLTFDPSVTATTYQNNLGGGGIPLLLAPFWEDLVCQGFGSGTASLPASMKYLVAGTAPNRVLTVEWLGMEIFSNPGPNLNFQVKLYETTNVIQYQYGVMSGFSGANNYFYTYSLGLTGAAPASAYLAQQAVNSNYFALANATSQSVDANGLAIVPVSFSQVQFVPAATLTTGTAPGTPGPPANNETAGAFTLPVIFYNPTSFATAYTSANATASAGITACTGTTAGTPDDDVWFKFTLTSTSNTTVTVRGSGGYDAVLQVFSNAGTTALGCVNATAAGFTENYNATLPAGTYFVRVYEAGTGSGTTGQFAVAAYVTPAVPANNECAAAVALTAAGTCTPTNGTTLGATASAGAPTCVGTPDDDVWYSFVTGASTGPYALVMQGSADFDGVVQVLSGTCGTYTAVSCTNTTLSNGAEVVTLNSLAANTTYYVRVYEFNAGYGSGDFTLCLTAPPALASFSPSPAGAGMLVTATGTNLAGATALSINGAAVSSFAVVNNTTLTFRVPAGATATGTSSVTTPSGTASSAAFGFLPAPGNALALDGADDYVGLPSGLNTANFTFEAWIKYQDNGTWARIFDFGTGTNTWMILGAKSGYAAPAAGNLHFGITTTGGGGAESTILSSTPLPVGQWQHVAVTLATTGSVTAGTLYLNGQVIGTNANLPLSPATLGTLANSWLGRSQYADPYLKAALDEVRVWNTARTQAQVQADMLAPATAPYPAGLQLYLSADQGTPAGSNTALTTLTDLVSAQPAALNNVALTSGNATSNYVESYAMVVPVATAATAITGTGFTANWTAPAVGVVDNGYRLDVSTVSTFASVIAGSPFTVASGTSRALTGLTAGTTYYYRVRADKTSVTGQGAASNVIAAAPACPVPVAIAQGVTASLDQSGSATVTAAQVNNGSTANCGPATALSLQRYATATVSGEMAEGGTLTLTAPNGGIFTAIGFASYGTPTGTAGSYAIGGCHASTSTAVVSAALLGNNTGSIGANNTTFGDPCGGTVKKLAVTATYEYYAAAAPVAAAVSYSCADIGRHYVQLTVTDAIGRTSTAPALVTVQDNLAPAAYLLPAAPALATANVPEAANYGVLYQLEVPNVAAFNSQTAIAYAENNASVALPANPARVAYFMELTNGATTKWVWASMNNFAANLTQLGLPNATANNVAWHQSVSGLNVFASTNSGVTAGSNLTGRVEMWRFNYGTNNVDGAPGASNSTFDFGDEVALNSGNYGSFQVHNLTAGQTLLAYNNWGGNGDGGGIGDLGIGNNPSIIATQNPDWTFSFGASAYSVKNIYILALNATSPTASFTQPATVPLDVNGNASVTPALVYKGNGIDNCGTATATVSPANLTCANLGPNNVTVTLTDSKGNATSQTAVVTVTAPTQPTTTWNGTASTDWTSCANWSYGQVPDAATNAVIPAGLARYPSLPAGTFAAKDLTIATGAVLTTASGATLQVNGNFANSGTATLSGPVAFVGSAATQTLSNASGFATIIVNKPAGTVQLAQNLTINSALTLTSGTLTTTASYQVNLGTSATLSESNTSYIIGKTVVSRTLAAGTAESFSGLGLTLTPAAASTAPGATLVTRTTGTAIAGAGTSQSILRNFNIQPAVNTGLNVTLSFGYFAHELNGIPVGSLAMFKSVSGGTPWIPQRGTTASPNVVTKTGITDFSVWTLGSTTTPLPVELTAFTATPEGPAAVRLAWTTASEKNSERFDVERSLDGTAFTALGTVPAAGSSSTPSRYTWLDGRLPAAAVLYYRLKQVDADGTFAYSPIRVVALGKAPADAEPALFPNPAHATATLTDAAPGTAVTVYDALGRLVATTRTDATGTATLPLPAGLPGCRPACTWCAPAPGPSASRWSKAVFRRLRRSPRVFRRGGFCVAVGRRAAGREASPPPTNARAPVGRPP